MLLVIIMYFEDPDKCPLLEDRIPQHKIIPHCVMLYDDLTLWTIEELCYKNFTKCPVYQKVKYEEKN